MSLKNFRVFLLFSKLQKRTRHFTTTAKLYDLNGKDLYSPKYGTSYYEPQQYEQNFFSKPQCIPNLKQLEKEKYDNIMQDDKSIYDCENESWTTDKFNDRED